MTNKECADILENLKAGIAYINSLVPEKDKDKIDIEALNFAIAILRSDREETT